VKFKGTKIERRYSSAGGDFKGVRRLEMPVFRCVSCMAEFKIGDALRFLPCVHIYHKECIDDWLMRSFTCPSCMEPVDAAILTTYE